ncbi:hypothetical protein CMI37_09030 [Candidatus Pacearchaeota archaeon]|nr:hypothetical protein [Candidatus Pacearchaeota archaeon]|tara:strand:+ start:156 stop:368 length:213 start_codon:yes stop_codon:yes gene_type:complete
MIKENVYWVIREDDEDGSMPLLDFADKDAAEEYANKLALEAGLNDTFIVLKIMSMHNITVNTSVDVEYPG